MIQKVASQALALSKRGAQETSLENAHVSFLPPIPNRVQKELFPGSGSQGFAQILASED